MWVLAIRANLLIRGSDEACHVHLERQEVFPRRAQACHHAELWYNQGTSVLTREGGSEVA